MINGNPTYAPGFDPNTMPVCSGYVKCRIPGDSSIWDAPDGQLGISFDDGPLPVRMCHACAVHSLTAYGNSKAAIACTRSCNKTTFLPVRVLRALHTWHLLTLWREAHFFIGVNILANPNVRLISYLSFVGCRLALCRSLTSRMTWAVISLCTHGEY
jgi:hypothetical protein